MCFDYDARPPELPADLCLPPLAGGAPSARIEVTSADGTRLSAYVAEARADGPVRARVLIFPDVRGLYPFYEELADRFAQAGHPAVAFDYFGRTAGLGPRDDAFEYMPHVLQTRLEQVEQDGAAALAALEQRVGPGPRASVGFCFGGMHSFLAGITGGLGLDRVVGFYGLLDGTRFGLPSVKDDAAGMRVPVLGLFGGEDPAIPPDHVAQLEASLDEAGVEHEVVTYEGAPHSFFDRSFAEHAEASADAWRRTLGFLGALG